MVIVENKRIEGMRIGTKTLGHIRLDKLAIPETVKVTVLGNVIVPVSYDCYGHPNFTEQQWRLFRFKEQLQRNQTPLNAEISYEEKSFDIQDSSFDTQEGIQESFANLVTLNEMLNNRKLAAFHGKELQEFILLGSYLLDKNGNVKYIEKNSKQAMRPESAVETFESFAKHNNYKIINGYGIPAPGNICPCCGKEITMNDMPCVYYQGISYHKECHREYVRTKETEKLVQLMDGIYNYTDYTFELIPNRSVQRGEYIATPWICFHTIDGDIVVGWREWDIFIEWQENYMPFNLAELFGGENVIKWDNVYNGRRGIYAWGKEKAHEYLKKARLAQQLQ